MYLAAAQSCSLQCRSPCSSLCSNNPHCRSSCVAGVNQLYLVHSHAAGKCQRCWHCIRCWHYDMRIEERDPSIWDRSIWNNSPLRDQDIRMARSPDSNFCHASVKNSVASDPGAGSATAGEYFHSLASPWLVTVVELRSMGSPDWWDVLWIFIRLLLGLYCICFSLNLEFSWFLWSQSTDFYKTFGSEMRL